MTRPLLTALAVLAHHWRDPSEWLGFAAFVLIVVQIPLWSALL